MSLAMLKAAPSPATMPLLGRIDIDLMPAEGAMLRVLGLVERRGFEVCGMAMARGGGRASMTLEVQPRGGERRLETVAAQLRRLHDVRTVAFTEGAV